MQSKKDKNQGFSLVEVLVAMTVLVVCAVPLLRAFVLSGYTNMQARENLNATTLAENVMERIKSDGVGKYTAGLSVDPSHTVMINGVAMQVYDVVYPSYLYDGKNYKIEVTLTPSSETYLDGSEKLLNGQVLTELVSMGRDTDAIYVQGKDDLWEVVDIFASGHVGVNAMDVLNNAETEYYFSIDQVRGFDVVEQRITHSFDEHGTLTPLENSVETVKIFDSLQSGQELKTLYIFFVPATNNQIVIENVNNIPLQVYLVRQGAAGVRNVTISVQDGIDSLAGSSNTQICTNLTGTELDGFNRGAMHSSSWAQAQSLFGMKPLDKTETLSAESARIYTVNIVVSKDGKQQAAMTGTALK